MFLASQATSCDKQKKEMIPPPVPLSVSGKTVPTAPVSGSGSVPEPPCQIFSVSCVGKKGGGIVTASWKGPRGCLRGGGGLVVQCIGCF